MPGIVGYDPTRTPQLERAARRAADHLLGLPPCADPLATAAVSAARLVGAHLETGWLPALGRVNSSTAMLGFTAASLRPLSTRLPAREGDGDVGPPASNSLDSELNPSTGRTTVPAAEPITGAVLPNGWEYTCGPVSASTGQPASGCEWMPPTPWDLRVPLLVASVLPGTGEVLDTYDCLVGDIPCEMVVVPFVSGRAAKALDDAVTTGARVADVRRSFDFTSADSWAETKTLHRHFEDHGADFAATSSEDYARQASDFFDRAVTENLPTKIDPDSGRIRFWDPATNTFGSYTPDGETVTFFKPTSPSYWEKQPE